MSSAPLKRFIHDLKRSHRCGSLRPAQVGETVVVMGWVQNRRDHGGCVFIDLRDREGIVQVVFDPQVDAEAHRLAGNLRSEWVLGVQGQVRSRGGNVNPRLPTGSIEVAAGRLEIFAEAKTPPFQIEDSIDTAEDVRLKYRYLDLRRPTLQRNLMWRHRFNQVVRQTLDEDGFLELETPFLIKSTPEGARDYVVPSRVNPGHFFALPQSPQLFKQLFMVSGYDRYFQITRCFRDEDLRAERQPEFTQIDLEMSFCSQQDVQLVVEKLLSRAFSTLLQVDIKPPFARLTYDESMARYGVDAPDVRFGLELVDLCEDLTGSTFKVFSEALGNGGVVKGINVTGVGDLSRKDLDECTEFVKIYNARGLAWAKIKEGGQWQSPIAKFLTDAERSAINKTLKLQPGDVAVFVADTLAVANAALGNLRKHLAKTRNLVAAGTHAFCWVTDFPMFEYDAAQKRHFAAHHPFTAPRPEDRHLLQSDPGRAKAQAYDITLNGVEIGGGSIRIHNSTLQQEVFTALGIGPAEAAQKFGFLLDALQYGAPPHGGVALGVDRILMQICGTPSIRDVIAFPKTQKQIDVMLDAPAPLEAAQLQELFIRSTAPSKEGTSKA
jgi:aspartyl-tRNA synthetase